MKTVDTLLLNKLFLNAEISPRLRTMHCFHEYPEDTLQRMINVMKRGSYIRPHRHVSPLKREIFVILSGRAACFEFDTLGNITQTYILDPLQGRFAVEITEKSFHTITSLSEFTAVFELKDGPYVPISDKDFAPWAPEENMPEVEKYLNNLISNI